MQRQLFDINSRPLLGGLLSFIPGLYQWWDSSRPTGNNISADYAQGIWNHHLEILRNFTSSHYTPKCVAELGPGASLGCCIAALKEGADTAIGLDACPYADNNSLNLALLNELFKEHTDPNLSIKLRNDLEALSKGNSHNSQQLKYHAPWDKLDKEHANSIDFIFSHSVLEHVTKPDSAYQILFNWLKPGGIMSHKIDHTSHAITSTLNGHYRVPNWLWRILRGEKPYLINRLTPFDHRELFLRNGFIILHESTSICDNASLMHPEIHNPAQRITTSNFVLQKPHH